MLKTVTTEESLAFTNAEKDRGAVVPFTSNPVVAELAAGTPEEEEEDPATEDRGAGATVPDQGSFVTGFSFG